MKTKKAFRRLRDEEGKFYTFLTKGFHDVVIEYVKKKKDAAKDCRYTFSMCFEELAKVVSVTPDSVKNWYRGYNGVNSFETIQAMAAFFQVDYHLLLKAEETMEDKCYIQHLELHLDEKALSDLFIKVRDDRDLIYAAYHAVVQLLDADREYISYMRDPKTPCTIIDYDEAARRILTYFDLVLGCTTGIKSRAAELVNKIGMLLVGYRGSHDTDQQIADLFGDDDEIQDELTNFWVRYCKDKTEVLKEDCVLPYFCMEEQYCKDFIIPCNYDVEDAFGEGCSLYIMNVGYYNADFEFVALEPEELASALGPLDESITLSPYDVHNHMMKFLIRPLFEDLLFEIQ